MSDREERTQCSDGSVLNRTECILSYDGEVLDIVINYSLLVVNFIWCLVALRFHTRDIDKSAKLHRFALGSFLFVCLFQVVLCLWVHCSGISIVWCAMGGWIISERKRLRNYNQVEQDVELSRLRDASVKWEYVVMLLDVAVIIYYSIEAPPIATVAHVLALILGASLSLMSIRLFNEQAMVDGEQPESPVSQTGSPTSGATTSLLNIFEKQ